MIMTRHGNVPMKRGVSGDVYDITNRHSSITCPCLVCANEALVLARVSVILGHSILHIWIFRSTS